MDTPVTFSVLDLAPIPAGSTVAEALRNSKDLAQHTERWGYHRYWLAEHHGMPGIASAATAVVIGHIAAATSRIRVGAGGVMLPNHAPLIVAEQFGTLHALFPGRIDLGIGRAPGSDLAAARALRRGMRSSSETFVQDLLELQSYFQPHVQKPPVRAIPGEGADIPIWLLGSSDFSARLAARLGLPFAFAAHFAPDHLYQALDIYRHEFEPSPALERPRVMIGLNVFAADTDEEGYFLSTSLLQMFIGLLRGSPGQLPPPVKSMEGLWSPEEEAKARRITQYSATGAQDTVMKKVQSLITDLRPDEIIVTSQIFHHAERLRSYEILAQGIGTLSGEGPGQETQDSGGDGYAVP